MKTYDLEDTGRGGYEPHYQLVESVDHRKAPDGLGEWVRREDSESHIRALAADRDRISLSLDLARADRDKWFNRARDLEKALRAAHPYVYNCEVADAADLEARYAVLSLIDTAFAAETLPEFDPAWVCGVCGKRHGPGQCLGAETACELCEGSGETGVTHHDGTQYSTKTPPCPACGGRGKKETESKS